MTSTPFGFQNFRQPRALFRSPSRIVFHRQPHEQRLVVGPVRAHRFGHLGDEAHPVQFGAAIFVRALVGFLRQEFMHEIAVGAVQFEHVEAGLIGAPRRLAPGLHQVFHLMALQRARHRPFLAVRDRARRHRRPGVPVVDLGRSLQRPVALPRAPGARLAAGMAELDAGDRVLLLDELHEAAERLDELVVPNAEVAHGAAAAALDLGRLDHDEAGAAGREFSGIHQMPVGRKSLVRGILMHRRHHDAVLQLDAANSSAVRTAAFRTWRFPGNFLVRPRRYTRRATAAKPKMPGVRGCGSADFPSLWPEWHGVLRRPAVRSQHTRNTFFRG